MLPSEETVGGYLSSNCYSHEEGGNYAYGKIDWYIRYNYDESGSVVGISLWEAGVDTQWTDFYFVKNLQGDVLQVYRESDNTLAAQYSYDSWGNLTGISGTLTYGGIAVKDLNPLRYRGYIFDQETGLYYLQSRYYNPEIGRFINADDPAYLGSGGFASFNLFSYCGNNPVMGYDPYGYFDWGIFTDIATTIVSAVIAIRTAVKECVKTFGRTLSVSKSVTAGIAAGIATFSAINNAANAIYYNYISDGESNLETTKENKSDYVDGYISRWDRLDYAKQQTGAAAYGFNAWRYNSEYSMHMYGWYTLLPFKESGNKRIQAFRTSLIRVHIEPHLEDTNWKTRVVTYVFGLLGL